MQSKAAENQEEEKIENILENMMGKVSTATSPCFFMTSRNHNTLIPRLHFQLMGSLFSPWDTPGDTS